MKKGTYGFLGLAAMGLFSACDSGQLPVDATLSVMPESRSLIIQPNLQADGSCVIDPGSFVDMPFVLNLRGPNGSPIGDADVSAFLDFAGNTSSGTPVLALFEDRNGNGIVDADTELVSDVDDDLAVVQTDDVSGDFTLLVRVNTSCPFVGDLVVFSDGLLDTATIALTTQPTTPEVPEFPTP